MFLAILEILIRIIHTYLSTRSYIIVASVQNSTNFATIWFLSKLDDLLSLGGEKDIERFHMVADTINLLKYKNV